MVSSYDMIIFVFLTVSDAMADLSNQPYEICFYIFTNAQKLNLYVNNKNDWILTAQNINSFYFL